MGHGACRRSAPRAGERYADLVARLGKWGVGGSGCDHVLVPLLVLIRLDELGQEKVSLHVRLDLRLLVGDEALSQIGRNRGEQALAVEPAEGVQNRAASRPIGDVGVHDVQQGAPSRGRARS